jgi:HD-like signal output (HDOD) protein
MKKRILFVEDNPLLLQMYAMMLGDEAGAWDVATAAGGEEALQRMAQDPFDVVVSDLRMPGMSGVELLTEVQRRHPRTSRIIISGLNDQEEAARLLDSTHQFLAKPFNVNALKATLNRICGLDAYLKDENLRALVGQFRTLPSFPSLYVDVLKELNSDEPSIESIAGIISKDPAMTAKMLQIVNSAAMGLSRSVSSPFEGVQFLGLGMVRSLVLSAHIFACFEHTGLKGFPVERLWDHGMKSGRIASMILQVEGADPGDIEDAYLAGMLHDMGKLMLADGMPDRFEQALALASERGIPLHDAEMEVLGASHAGVAAYLLGLWGLPASIVEAVAFHHAPAQSELRAFGPLAAVHAANAIEHGLSAKGGPDGTVWLDLPYFAALGMEERISVWRREAIQLLANDKSFTEPEEPSKAGRSPRHS